MSSKMLKFVSTEKAMPEKRLAKNRVTDFDEAEDPIRAFKKNLELRPEGDTELVHVTYEYTDPEKAALFANTLAEVYMDRNLEKARKDADDARDRLEEQREAYLQRKLEIVRPNHVWCADVTYIPMRRGFLYLVAVMDWATRKVLAWRLSNTMDAGFCVAALEEALARFGRPEIFNTDQGSQFTSLAFTSVLRDAEVRISMDGRGRWMDNVFIERLWRSLKYECVYLHAFETGSELRTGLARWITYYNTQRPHSGLAGQTPAEAYGRIDASDHGGHAPHDLMTRLAA